MILHELPFCKIVSLQDDIAEVVIDEGVEMDEVMVQAYHDLLLKKFTAPFSLLVNKINSYAYTWEAQQMLGTLTEINAMAVVVYSKVSEGSTQFLTKIPRKQKWNLKIFEDRESALTWLTQEQGKVQ